MYYVDWFDDDAEQVSGYGIMYEVKIGDARWVTIRGKVLIFDHTGDAEAVCKLLNFVVKSLK